MKLRQRLWNDEAGFIVSAELIMIATIIIIGLVVGLAAVRDGINSELADLAQAFNSLNQGYRFSSVVGHAASVAGTTWNDNTDFCDSGTSDAATVDEACVTHITGATSESVPSPAVP